MNISDIRPGEALIRVACAGISAADLEVFGGDLGRTDEKAARYPIVPGHELSGRIAQVSQNASGLKPSDAVVVEEIQKAGTSPHARMGSRLAFFAAVAPMLTTSRRLSICHMSIACRTAWTSNARPSPSRRRKFSRGYAQFRLPCRISGSVQCSVRSLTRRFETPVRRKHRRCYADYSRIAERGSNRCPGCHRRGRVSTADRIVGGEPRQRGASR